MKFFFLIMIIFFLSIKFFFLSMKFFFLFMKYFFLSINFSFHFFIPGLKMRFIDKLWRIKVAFYFQAAVLLSCKSCFKQTGKKTSKEKYLSASWGKIEGFLKPLRPSQYFCIDRLGGLNCSPNIPRGSSLLDNGFIFLQNCLFLFYLFILFPQKKIHCHANRTNEQQRWEGVSTKCVRWFENKLNCLKQQRLWRPTFRATLLLLQVLKMSKFITTNSNKVITNKTFLLYYGYNSSYGYDVFCIYILLLRNSLYSIHYPSS